MKVEYIAIVVLTVVVLSIVAGGIGLMAEPDFVHDEVAEPTLWGGVTYVWDNIVFMAKMVTFQVPGIPPVVNMLVIFPLMAGVVYLIVRLVRGGG